MIFRKLAVVLFFVSACSESQTKTSESDAGFDLSEQTDVLQEQDVWVDASAEDVSVAEDAVLIDVGIDPAVGGIGGFVSSGTGYFEPTVLGVEAFAEGGAYIVVQHRGQISIPPVYDQTPAADTDQILGVVVDDTGEVQHVDVLAVGTARFELFPLNRGVAIALSVHPDAVVPLDATSTDQWRSVLLVAEYPNRLTRRAVLTSDALTPEFSTVVEGAGGLLIASLQTAAQQVLAVDGGVTTVIPAAGEPRSQWERHPWIARTTRNQNYLTFFGGLGSGHVNTMHPTSDGGLWICGDVGGYESDTTIILGEGTASERTLTAVSPDDDPSSDVFFARLDAGGAVQAAWLHYGYTNSLQRPCSITTVEGDLVASVSMHAQYLENELRYSWTASDGAPQSVRANYSIDAQILARYSPTGQLRWFNEYSAGKVAPRVWVDGESVRVGASFSSQDTALKGGLRETTLRAEPDALRGVSTRLSFDLESGLPAELVGGGVAGGTLLANGHVLVAIVGNDETVMGTSGETQVICPASDTPQLCVAVIGPAAVVNSVIKQ